MVFVSQVVCLEFIHVALLNTEYNQPLSLSYYYMCPMFSSFLISSLPHQVSAEPDGSSYVFQGFIQGKDYGQFGLQRLGNSLWV